MGEGSVRVKALTGIEDKAMVNIIDMQRSF